MLQPVYYSGPWGPWNPRYEAVYRRLERSLQPLLARDASARAEAFRHYDLDTLAPLLEQFQQYRLARLTAYLRQREPDTTLNDAILVYHLTDAELARALD
jgi:alpha-L-fucosidase